jgi:hypothetical protein
LIQHVGRSVWAWPVIVGVHNTSIGAR